MHAVCQQRVQQHPALERAPAQRREAGRRQTELAKRDPWSLSSRFPGTTDEEASDLYDRAWSSHFKKWQDEFKVNDPEGHAKWLAKIEADADEASIRLSARLSLYEKLDDLVGKTVIVEKIGIENTCCAIHLEGVLKPHEDGMGSFILSIGATANGPVFFGFYPSSVHEIVLKMGSTVPIIRLN